MDKKEKRLIFALILLFIFIFILRLNSKVIELNKSLSESGDEVLALEIENDSYADALEEANSNIQELNDEIETAQSSTWLTYEEMGESLDGLYVVDEVDSPY